MIYKHCQFRTNLTAFCLNLQNKFDILLLFMCHNQMQASYVLFFLGLQWLCFPKKKNILSTFYLHLKKKLFA